MAGLMLAARRVGTGLALGGLLLFPAVGSAQDAAGTHSLRLKFAKGEVCKYRMIMDMEMTMMGQEIGMRFEQDFEQKVSSVEADGVGTLECKIARVAMEMSMPMMGVEMAFDSDKDKPEAEGEEGADAGNPMAAALGPMKKVFRAMVGKPFTMVQAPDGKVRKVTGFSKILDDVLPAGGDDPMADMMRKQMKSQVSDEAMQKQMGQMSVMLPKDPVAIGATWKDSMEVPLPNMPKAMKAETTCTLEKVEEGVAHIANQMKMSLTDAAPAGGEGEGEGDPQAEMMKMMKFDMKDSKGKGTIKFDIAGGSILEVAQTMSMKMSMGMPGMPGGDGGEGGAGGMEMDMQIKMSMKRISRTAVTQGF